MKTRTEYSNCFPYCFLMKVWKSYILFGLMFSQHHLLCDSQEITEQVATFRGGYLTYKISSGSLSGSSDQVNFDFKTAHSESFLFYAGSLFHEGVTPFHILISLKRGRVAVQVHHFKSIEREVPCQSDKATCADNQWHQLRVERKAEMWTPSNGSLLIGITLDGTRFPDLQIEDIQRHLSIKTLFLGGYPHNSEEFPLKYNVNNFIGCIRNPEYGTDNIKLKIITFATKYVQKVGDVVLNRCIDNERGQLNFITFSSPESFLVIPGWSTVSEGSLKFSFRTTETKGLLLYQHAGNIPTNRRDFLAFELRDGGLFFVMNMGGSTYRSFVQKNIVKDGLLHTVELIVTDGRITIFLDDIKKITKPRSPHYSFNFNGDLYVGGLPQPINSNGAYPSVPYEVWSGVLGDGYVGCVGDIQINGVVKSLYQESLKRNTSGIVKGCDNRSLGNQCENRPCHNGQCVRGWHRFICDCTKTNFTGQTCSERASIVQFNGLQFMKINFNKGFATEAEDITLRFQTERPNGLLFKTVSPASAAKDHLEVRIENGNVVVQVNLGDQTQNISTEKRVYDNAWHSLTLTRRLHDLKLIVDDSSYSMRISGSKSLQSYEEFNVGRTSTNQFFVGHMMHFSFNGVNYFELANSDSSPLNIEVTAKLAYAEHIKQFPMHFISKDSFIKLPKRNLFGDFHFEFWFKTSLYSGLIALLDGESGDYILLELTEGRLRLVFNWGSGPITQFSKTSSLNDTKWHRVQLVRSKSPSQSLAFRVDGKPTGKAANINVSPGGVNFNQRADVYLGGVGPSGLPHLKISLPLSFQGCIASFYLNKTDEIDLGVSNSQDNFFNKDYPIKIENPFQTKVASFNVTQGCSLEMHGRCTPNLCNFGGRCIQQWKRISCECSRTSFTGETCHKIGKTVKLGSSDKPGYASFEFKPLKNTIRDEITFGMQTSQRVQALLISIVGKGDSPDFIEVHIRDDKGRSVIEVRYNVGSATHSVVETAANIADGKYHVVKFTRDGPNGTLQIDNLPRKLFWPKGPQNNQFNNQYRITIGNENWFSSQRRKRDASSSKSLNRLTRYASNLKQIKRFAEYRFYNGYLSGLVFNRYEISEILDEPNKSVSGISLVNRSNIHNEPNFTPNLNNYPPPIKKLPKWSLENPKDNMQSTTGNKKGKLNSSDGLILPVDSPNCPKPTPDCVSENNNGIVTPRVYHKQKTDPMIAITQSPSTNEGKVFYPNIIDSQNPSNSNNQKDLQGTSRRSPDIIRIPINLWLIIAVSSCGALVLLALTCVIYRCRRKSEGSYDVEESHNFREPLTLNYVEPSLIQANTFTNNGNLKSFGNELNSSKPQSKAALRKQKKNHSVTDKKKDTREWYV